MVRPFKPYAVATLIAIGAMFAGVDIMAAQSAQTLATSVKPIVLGTAPVSVTLSAPAGGSLSARLAKGTDGRKVFLVVKGLRTNEQPEVLYQLFLGLPPGEAPKPDGIHFVGSLNFFNATRPGTDDPRFFSYDVTDLIEALRARKSLGDDITVTAVPAARPNTAAKPQIGEIALVEQ